MAKWLDVSNINASKTVFSIVFIGAYFFAKVQKK